MFFDMVSNFSTGFKFHVLEEQQKKKKIPKPNSNFGCLT